MERFEDVESNGRRPGKRKDTAARILLAAERVFGERGFRGARTRDIAAAARANLSAIHYHFGSKEDLYGAVLRERFGELRRAVDAALQREKEPAARVHAFVDAHFDMIASHPDMPRIMVDAVLRNEPAVRAVVRDTIRPIFDALVATLADSIESRKIRPVDPRQTMISAIGMNAIYFVARALVEELFGSENEAYSPAAVAARKEHVVDLLLLGLLPREQLP